jgi:nucleoside-diphosphate-sugar epimerase
MGTFMNKTAEFLVFGATGQQGGAVAIALRAQGREVRALYGIHIAKRLRL